MATKKMAKFDMPSLAQKKFDESVERAGQTVEAAQRAIEGHPIPQKAVVVSDDPAYRAAACSYLRERGDYEIVAVDPSEDLNAILNGSMNVVFLISYDQRHLEALGKNLSKKIIAVAPKDEALLGRLRDMRAVVVTSPLSPEMLQIAF